jgi:integrase
MPRRAANRTTTRHRCTRGAVRELPSGRYQARYTGPDGVTRPLGTFATKDEADLAIAGQTVDVARGDWVNPTAGRITLGVYLRTWIATRDLADSTRDLYRYLAETWIDAEIPGLDLGNGPTETVHLGHYPIGALSLPLVREWDAAVLAEATRRANARWEKARHRPRNVNASIRRWAARNGAAMAATGRIPAAARQAWVKATGGVPDAVKPGHHNAGRTESVQAYRLLRAVLYQPLEDKAITENPCRIDGAATRDCDERAERRIATPEEMWALADLMPDRYRAALIVAYLSGLRPGELFSLQRCHVDLVAGTIRVEQSLNRNAAGDDWFSSPKTKTSRREVPVGTTAARVLAEHMDRYTPDDPDALVFGTKNGTPVSPSYRSKMLGRVRRAIGRADLTWHDQRHSNLTLAAMAGATVKELMDRAGHSTSAAALHYQHTAADSQRRIADRVDELVAGEGARERNAA